MRSRAGDVIPQRHVTPRDPRVGLAAAHLSVGDQRGEERPLPCHLLQRPGRDVRAPRAARSRDRARREARSATASTRTPTGSPAARRSRRRPAAGRDANRDAGARPPRPASTAEEELDEVRVLVHEPAIHRLRGHSHLLDHLLVERRMRARGLVADASRPRQQRRAGRRARARGGRSPPTVYLAVSTSPCSVIFSRPSTVPGRQRQDRVVGRAAAAADRAAAAVEEDPADAVAPRAPRRSGSGRGRCPSRTRRSRRPCWSPSTRSSPPAGRRRRAVPRGRPASRAASRSSRGAAASVAPASNSGTIRSCASLAAGLREARLLHQQQHLEHV